MENKVYSICISMEAVWFVRCILQIAISTYVKLVFPNADIKQQNTHNII